MTGIREILPIPLPPTFGGTGVANTASETITLAGPLVTSGAHSLTLTTTADTNVTFPTSGTLATTAGTPTGANPTATASDTAVNGSASTFMRSDGAPAVQKTSASVFGLCKVDGSTITASGGVITSTAATPSTGSWTPADASGAGLSFTVASATYIKIGSLVFVQARLTYPVTGNGSNAAISGLPFTVAGNAQQILPTLSSNATITWSVLNGTTATPSTLGGNTVTNVSLSGTVIIITGVYTT